MQNTCKQQEKSGLKKETLNIFLTKKQYVLWGLNR